MEKQQNAIKSEKNYKVLHQQGFELYDFGVESGELNLIEEAITFYDQCLKIKPDFYFAWHNRGRALNAFEKYKKAIESYDQALKIEPQHWDSHRNRGITLHKLGNNEEAITSFDLALKIRPDCYETWNVKAVVLYNLGRYKEAIKCLDQALKIRPDYRPALQNRKIAVQHYSCL